MATAPKRIKRPPRLHPGHGLIIGRTGSGKTTAASAMISQYCARGGICIVGGSTPDDRTRYIRAGAWCIPDMESFIATLRANQGRRMLIVWDEATTTFDPRDHAQIPTQARHWRYQVVFVAHKYTAAIPPIVRESCTWCCLLRVGMSTARAAADDYAAPELIEAAAQAPGEWILSHPHGVEKGRLW